MSNPTPAALPEVPGKLKAVSIHMKTAQDIEKHDPVVAYWLRLYSLESALKIDKTSAECKPFIIALLTWLEQFKQSHKDNETVTNETVGQAHYENFAVNIFNKVDALDREGTANVKTIRMFFMAAILFEAMGVFGTVTDEITQRAKYAKFKAAYIQKCIKAGQTPKPGPVEGADLEVGASDASTQPPAVTTTPLMPQMPMPGDQSGGGGLYIPEVPEDPSDNSTPAAAIIPPKPTDPFILTPSVPPPSSIIKPSPAPAPVVPASSLNMPASDPKRSTIAEARFLATNGTPLNPEDILKGQKYCKFANSALQYDDIPTAVANLQKALKLLTTGQNPE